MAKSDFAHLHVHSEYSLLDGLGSPANIVEKAKRLGMSSIAITDHGAMYGAIEFYKAAKEAGIKPIIGLEAYVSNQDHKIKGKDKKVETYHLILLAKNETGYKNLMKLTSIAHLEGYYYRPKFDKENLKKLKEGLICLSGCPLAEVPQLIGNGQFGRAKETALWFRELFGEDYYLEVQRHEYEKFARETRTAEIRQELERMAQLEKTINDGIVKLSRELGLPIVATNDSHYIEKEDADAQDVMLCVATGKTTNEVNRIRFIDSPTLYIRSKEEMENLFPDIPEAIPNTMKVSDKCNVEISTLGSWFFPKYPLPADQTAESYLKKQIDEKLPEKYKEVTEVIKERIDKELEIIVNKGFAPYFLIVSDMAQWAKKEGIVTNTRGSAAGSIISYILDITTVDPIHYNLPFERFLNPFRPTPPDIDFDVADDKRDQVIQYLVDTYGVSKVAQICTFGRMLARGAVRDVARVLGFPYAVGDRIAKVIPPPRQGFPVNIPKALKISSELRAMYDGDKDAKKVLDLAHKVEGSARHISVHAAAVVISPSEMTDFTPIQHEPAGDKIITQYEMHSIDEVGLIKFDILGITNLSTLGSSIKIVKKLRNLDVDIQKIPLDDKKTFEMLSRGETFGVFQMGSSGMTRYLMELKPTNVDDLMAMVALYRPGPIDVIPEYIARKNNPKKVAYKDPRMKKFLDKSFGLLVYQDDLLFCCIDLAGYTWEEADKFRKAVGKKIPAEMAAQKAKFIKGIIENGQTKDFAEDLWRLFEPFQAYGFNKAHAASYGMVAYHTAYMKANFPVEYMCALLTADAGNSEKVAQGIAESRRMGIHILPPDVNTSRDGFTIIDYQGSLGGKAIRFGLSAIKNVGEAAIETIIETRKEAGQYKSLGDFCRRVDTRKVNKRVLESLIKAGAMDRFGNRAGLLAGADQIRERAARSQQKKDINQGSLFGAEDEDQEPVSLEEDKLPEVDDFTQEEKLNFERELMGLYVSSHPFEEALKKIKGILTHKIFQISGSEHVGQTVKIGGMISDCRVVLTRNGRREMAFVKFEDETGNIDLVVFPNIFAETKNYWEFRTAIVIQGKVEYREDSLSIIVETVKTVDEAVAADKIDLSRIEENTLRIPRGTNPKALLELNKLLRESRGDDDLIILIENGYGEKKIKLPYGVSWTRDLRQKAQNIIQN